MEKKLDTGDIERTMLIAKSLMSTRNLKLEFLR